MTDLSHLDDWACDDPLAIGRRVLAEEAAALQRTAGVLGADFVAAVRAILGCRGRVVVSGVGKSGHVGRKVAATLASTGTPAFFVHAAEAGHGDLGMITADDIVLVISNSGESDEVVNIAAFARRFGARIVAMTGKPGSRVAQLADIHLDSSVTHEACPLGVAPTSSTTVQLALGDALAMAALAGRGFTTEDFARTHPLGQLGRQYYLRVRDVMQGMDEVPNCAPDTRLLDAIPEMATGRMGALLVLRGGVLEGLFTESDLRRLITGSGGQFDALLQRPVGDFVTRHPMTIGADRLASEALAVLEEKRVGRLVCVDGDKPVGLLAWHNLLQHKVA